ncbi:unnamed protein product, partial [Polarella glacialis]
QLTNSGMVGKHEIRKIMDSNMDEDDIPLSDKEIMRMIKQAQDSDKQVQPGEDGSAKSETDHLLHFDGFLRLVSKLLSELSNDQRELNGIS